MSARSFRRVLPVLFAVLVAAGAVLVPSSASAADSLVLVTDQDSNAPSAWAAWPVIDDDGSRVLYEYTIDEEDIGPGSPYVADNHLYLRDLVSGSTVLVDEGPGGVPADSGVWGNYEMSGDYVVYTSNASNLVGPGSTDCDGGRCADVYLRNLAGGTTNLHIGPDGSPGNGHAGEVRISDVDQSRPPVVAFTSLATNLVAGDTREGMGVFLTDTAGAPIRRVNGTDTPDWQLENLALSGDGSTAAVTVGSSRNRKVFLIDVATTTATPLPVPGASWKPTLSHDGRLVLFLGSDVVPPEEDFATFDDPDAYLYDRSNGDLRLVSTNNAGAQLGREVEDAEISDDGSTVLFVGRPGLVSGPTGSHAVYVRNLATGEIAVATTSSAHMPSFRYLSDDGTHVTWATHEALLPEDTDGEGNDVYLATVSWPAGPGGGLDGSGDPVVFGAEATDAQPLVATIDPPTDLTGSLSVEPQPAEADGAPAGFAFFGTQLRIEGPGASPADPYVVTFTVDASQLGTVTPSDVQVFRNGALVGDCTAAGATPDPCVAARAAAAGGDATVTVRTSAFSTWNLGRLAYAVSGPYVLKRYPASNSVKAGSVVPVAFRIDGRRGADVLASGYPVVRSCSGGTAQPAQTPGSAQLIYERFTSSYVYLWQTPRGTTGCRDLVVLFRDGQDLTVRVTLR
jgi:hypothetical protein